MKKELSFLEGMELMAQICEGQSDCGSCPMVSHDGRCPGCDAVVKLSREELYDAMTKWRDERREKTILDDFIERNPNAIFNNRGVPVTCAQNMGYVDDCPNDVFQDRRTECETCWERLYDAETGKAKGGVKG